MLNYTIYNRGLLTIVLIQDQLTFIIKDIWNSLLPIQLNKFFSNIGIFE